ncbi:uncharacterized protein RHO17_025572 isoform 2-T2 [Thomomys bottae]
MSQLWRRRARDASEMRVPLGRDCAGLCWECPQRRTEGRQQDTEKAAGQGTGVTRPQAEESTVRRSWGRGKNTFLQNIKQEMDV